MIFDVNGIQWRLLNIVVYLVKPFLHHLQLFGEPINAWTKNSWYYIWLIILGATIRYIQLNFQHGWLGQSVSTYRLLDDHVDHNRQKLLEMVLIDLGWIARGIYSGIHGWMALDSQGIPYLASPRTQVLFLLITSLVGPYLTTSLALCALSIRGCYEDFL